MASLTDRWLHVPERIDTSVVAKLQHDAGLAYPGVADYQEFGSFRTHIYSRHSP